MTILESKEKLKKDGYTSFQLSEFDPEFYNLLLPLKCNETDNIKSKMAYLKVNAEEYLTPEQKSEKTSKGEEIIDIRFHTDFETFDSALEKKNEIFDLLQKNKNVICSQIWFYNDFARIVPDVDDFNVFKKHIDKLVRHYFDFEETQELLLFSPSFTYYDEGCHLANHSDGTGTGRVCALLIYLNETYDENDGGILVLNNKERVTPLFANVAIIDLQSFDIPHMVTKVTGGIGRYAMLTFVKKKEDEFIHSKYDMKQLI